MLPMNRLQPTTHEEQKPQFNRPQEFNLTNNHVGVLESGFFQSNFMLTIVLEETQTQGTQPNVIPDLSKL